MCAGGNRETILITRSDRPDAKFLSAMIDTCFNHQEGIKVSFDDGSIVRPSRAKELRTSRRLFELRSLIEPSPTSSFVD